MEYINGKVKTIPIQNPINPRQVIIVLTMSNPNKTKTCFETIIKLPFIDSNAESLPKIISGMVRKFKNEII